MKLIKVGLASIIAAGALYAGTYNVDPAHSNVGFKVKHLMISNVRGNFEKFAGSFVYDEKTGAIKSVTGTAEVDSINTDNEKRDGHLKSADFFDAANHPKLTLKIEKVEGEKAYGKLTMRGVTKDVVFEIEKTGEAVDPWGNKRVALEIEGEVNRKDFGLNWNKALEAGGVMVSEEVNINLEIQGILEK
ncbi:YceI family protein [Halarcobacter sp.]|uniref:YceI family protein n=1 Tax=Halarcobacter sp. TaxID=2321133 RepID=UPI0029F53EFB|nr:YceI family protein [Halarcobacter sp.]